MSSDRKLRAAKFLQTVGLRGGAPAAESAFESKDASVGHDRPPVTDFELLGVREKVAVEGALKKLNRPLDMTNEEQLALEAIIIPDRRPVIDIFENRYTVQEAGWLHLNEEGPKAVLARSIPAVGRLEIPGHPRIPFAGTAFLVASDVIMTNRHVAELLVEGLGRHQLHVRFPGGMNFAGEAGNPGEPSFIVDEALLVHPFWDLALLRVRDVAPAVEPLTLAAQDPLTDGSVDIAVIGYPAFDPLRNDVEVQHRVFRNLYDVKRLQPGKLLPRTAIASFGNKVEALTHDSSTLGGNSGSAIIDIRRGRVVALHFGGRYLDRNFAVPAADVALDSRMRDFGIKFDDGAGLQQPREGPWAAAWTSIEAGRGTADERNLEREPRTDPSPGGGNRDGPGDGRGGTARP